MTHPEWPDGLWQDEPDRDQWKDDASGLLCLVARAAGGHLCGYVAVPEDHPWHSRQLPDLTGSYDDTHGGLTYSALGNEHISWTAGEPDGRWWIGFSCDHIGDLVPAAFARMSDFEQAMSSDFYRDLAWVRREVRHLAVDVHDAR